MSHPAWHGFDEIPREVLGDPDTIFLNLSGGWQQVPDYIRRAGLNAVEEGYLKIQPVPEFNRAVADKFRNDFNVEVDPTGEVIPCNGAGDGLLAVLSVLLNPGDEVITFDPGLHPVLPDPCLSWSNCQDNPADRGRRRTGRHGYHGSAPGPASDTAYAGFYHRQSRQPHRSRFPAGFSRASGQAAAPGMVFRWSKTRYTRRWFIRRISSAP